MARITPEYIKNKWTTLAARFDPEWNRMLLVEAWRTLNHAALKPHIWEGVAEQDHGNITIVKNHVASVTASAIALASSPEPNVTVRMRNRISPQAQNDANYNRRAVLGMRAEINRCRTQPWEDESTDYIFARGVGITKRGFLDPESRGEVREPLTADAVREFDDARIVNQTDELGEVVQSELIVEDGEFPGFVEVLDPLDCVYVLGPGKSGVKCFIHHYTCPPEDLLATYPDALEKLNLGDDIDNHADFEVYDYYDDKFHAIIVDGEFYYPPTEHHAKRLPFEVERVNEQKLMLGRYSRADTVTMPNGEIGELGGGSSGTHLRVATPFPWPMIDDVAKASFAESLLASKLPEMANTPIIHQGISSGAAGPASPYFQREQRSDGRISKVPVYRFRGDKSAGGRPVWPLFDGENMYPLNPTPIADHLAIFMQQRNADLEISGMNAELLSGRTKSDLSGFSVNQQLQLTSARMNPYVAARNRLVSKTYTGMFNDLAANWDRADAPFILTSLTDEQDVEISREMVEGVIEVVYTVENIFPRDRQAEMQMAFQMTAQGAMPLSELINLYGKAESPQDWLEQVAWERVALQDPQFLRSLAMARHKKLGYGEMGPSAEAQAQAGQMAQMQQMAAMAGGMTPEGAPVEGGGNGQLPPELAAALGAVEGGP